MLSFSPCQHRASPWSTPCPHCERIERHRHLRRTNPFIPGKKTPGCEHRGPGQFLPCEQCNPMDYERYVLRRNSREDPITAEQFADDDERIMRAIHEERILRRTPTQISWCLRCGRNICSGDCDSTLFEKEAAMLRGDTPVATSAEEGYSSSETIRPRGILYSPALVRKIETRTRAVQTRRTRIRNRATQTEAEAIPLHAPPPAQRIIYIRKKTMWHLKPTVASVVSVAWNGTYAILW